MKAKSLAVIFGLLVVGGCARFSTIQTDMSYDDQGKPQRQVTTKATAYTLWSSKSALASWKATQTDSSQGATVGNLTQQSLSPIDTNFVALVGIALGTAMRTMLPIK